MESVVIGDRSVVIEFSVEYMELLEFEMDGD